MNNVAKPIATPTIGGREMKSKTATPSALNSSIQPSAVPTAPNRVAKPGPTNPLLEKRERTGAKAIVQAPSASVPHQTLKTDASRSTVKRDKKTDIDVKLKHGDRRPHVKSSSPRKIAANRSNSKQSTGPRTARGKSHSRWNSHKYGIMAKALLVVDGPGAENVAEFNKLLDGLRQSWQPKGKREESLVETIAICDWRMARSLRAEAGLISRGVVIDNAGQAPEIVALGLVLGRDETDERERELKEITSHRSLPLNRRLDLILRYQTTIQRIQASAINQLEGLQLRRKGDDASPPIKVHVSTE
jgi:hypothetical protein